MTIKVIPQERKITINENIKIKKERKPFPNLGTHARWGNSKSPPTEISPRIRNKMLRLVSHKTYNMHKIWATTRNG